MTEEELAAIRARTEAATPGPWYVGERMALAGVLPETFGEDKCAYCKQLGEPVWVGRADINGRRMKAHIHLRGDENAFTWDTHHVYAWPNEPAPAETLVCGNYDYDEGGVVRPEDAAFIAHARTDIPALLDEIERLKDLVVALEQRLDIAENQVAAVRRYVTGRSEVGVHDILGVIAAATPEGFEL